MKIRLGLFLALLTGGPLCAQDLPADVQAVIDRSKSTRISYAVVVTAEVGWNDRRWTETQAEFQQGSMHRVEVPATHVLANCDTAEFHVYDVVQGRLVDRPETGGDACGISIGADRVISGRLLEPVTGDYGRADVIELIGADFIRRYAVTEDGIIVATAYVPRRAEIAFSLRTLTVTVRRGRQDPLLFELRSLDRAFASGPPTNVTRVPANSDGATSPVG